MCREDVIMAENKNYWYLRLKEHFFDEDAIQILESMQDGYLYSNILLKLYLKSLKGDGKLMFNNVIPYNSNVLATITHHQVGTIERALNVFQEMNLIEILDNGAIYMLNIQDLIGKSSTEADRKREYRAKIDAEKKNLALKISDGTNVQTNLESCMEKHPPEIEIDKNIELEIDEDSNINQIFELYQKICKSLPVARELSKRRKQHITDSLKIYALEDFKRVFLIAESNDYLKGINEHGWKASFDWLIKADNMEKVLIGYYKKHSVSKKSNKGNNYTPDRKNDYDSEEMQNLLATTPPVK